MYDVYASFNKYAFELIINKKKKIFFLFFNFELLKLIFFFIFNGNSCN